MSMTSEQKLTLDYLQRAIEYAPKTASHAPDIHGWRTPDGLYICADHVARIFARGCAIPMGSRVVWLDEAATKGGVCCLCDRERVAGIDEDAGMPPWEGRE